MADYLLTYSTREDWLQRATVRLVSEEAPARHRLISASKKPEAIRLAQKLCKENGWTMHSLQTRRWCEATARMIARLKIAAMTDGRTALADEPPFAAPMIGKGMETPTPD